MGPPPAVLLFVLADVVAIGQDLEREPALAVWPPAFHGGGNAKEAIGRSRSRSPTLGLLLKGLPDRSRNFHVSLSLSRLEEKGVSSEIA
uniref:Putative secreted protein n=1 Tax=Ixodes ricinus TaxID=34613 RepID=A0A6B0U0B4_IXORI